jgi:dTDP-4-amino-4,6-dideoxygalactose transaminase
MIWRRQLPVHSAQTLRALLSGTLGALGVHAEKALAWRMRNHWGAREILLTSSGTAALALAMRAALRGEDGPIALPAYGCYDLATAALGAGVRVVLYDVDPHSLGPDEASLSRALERKPRALVLAHLYGLPVNVPAIARQTAAAGVVILEDAAQGLGALVRGQPAGSLGSTSILSFGRGKGLTGGAGGALLANDSLGETLLDQARSVLHGGRAGWSELARACAQWVFGRPLLYPLPAALPFLRLGETVFQSPEPPRLLSRAAASMIFRNWKPAFSAIARRRALAARLVTSARTNGFWQTFSLTPDTVPGYLRLPLLAQGNTRKAVLTRAALRLGIAPGYPLPLSKLPGFAQHCINGDEPFPGAEYLAERLFTLPTHELLTDGDVIALQRWLTQPGLNQLTAERDRVVAGA